MTEPIITWEKFFPPSDKTNDYDKQDEDKPYDDGYSDNHGQILLVSNEQTAEDEYIAREFNVWVMHTNFDIMDEVEAIQNIDGVEHVGTVSRYRLKVAFARLFDESETKEKIRDYLLGPNHKNLPLSQEGEELIREAKEYCQNYSNWAIFMFPNGRVITSITNDDIDTHLSKIAQFKEIRSKVGGVLLTSEINASLD